MNVELLTILSSPCMHACMHGNGSYAKIQNGKFLALAYQPSTEIFGTSLIQQGDCPYGWGSSPSRLKRELTVSLDEEQPLILDVQGKRTSPIEWFTGNSKQRFNNIGFLLIGDVGLGYHNPDTKQPHAFYIDLWIDTNPQVDRRVSHDWNGTDIENDYHSGHVIGFGKYRIDKLIKGALNHRNLQKFTIKMVQCYIEAKASKASMEITKIDFGIP